VIIDFLSPIQERYFQIRKDPSYLNKVFADGLKRAKRISQQTLALVYQAMGLG